MNLGASLIAVVGPNEAGKTTFLKALHSMDSGQATSLNLRSRSLDLDSNRESFVECIYRLEDSDLAKLEEFDLEMEPATIKLTKELSASSNRLEIFPEPQKSTMRLGKSSDTLKSILELEDISKAIVPSNTLTENSIDLENYVEKISSLLGEIDRVIGDSSVELPNSSTETLRLLNASTDREHALGGQVGKCFDEILDWIEHSNPRPGIDRALRELIPEFVLFAEADRDLKSSYRLDEKLLANTPRALSSLAEAAGLDLAALQDSVAKGDKSRSLSRLQKANVRLSEIFEQSWKQSKLTVKFQMDGGFLEISLMDDDANVSVYSERSAGLKMFVALTAFLRARKSQRPAVLLVDEAEIHLHIDAQADLVNMFVSQELANKIIYTTHSPACLPPDLGTGIRVVVPEEGEDRKSKVLNSFWTSNTGFSPLMMAMGAGSAAFTPARYVVLAEGASDMILLPTLLRHALDRPVVYQIAPGLSEASQNLMRSLDLEASRVAYLVDEDEGGRALGKMLLNASVPETKIIHLSGKGPEDLVEGENLVTAFGLLMRERNSTFDSFTEDEVTNFKQSVSVSKSLFDWTKKNGYKAPSKVAIATRLVEEDLAVPSIQGRASLVDVDKRIETALGLETEELR